MLGATMAKDRPTLYVLTGSHPCMAVEAALRLKGIDYKRVDLLPLSQMLLGPILYGGRTVPGMRLGGERIVGSRTIMRRLDELVAEPALLPAPGTAEYSQVLEAERWGDEVFQSVPRRIVDAGFLRRPDVMESYAGDAKLALPRPVLRPALPVTAKLMARVNGAKDGAVRADIGGLPRQLDRIDGWMAEGLLGGESPNAADLQIGATILLLMTIGDVAGLVRGRPAEGLTRYFQAMPGEVPRRHASGGVAERRGSRRRLRRSLPSLQSPCGGECARSSAALPARAMHTLDPQSLAKHVDRLYRAAWALCGSREDAEDLVQETFAKVLSRPRTLRGDDDLYYLMRVLRNTFLTNIRTASRRPVTVATLEDVTAADPRPTTRPDRALEVQELYSTIAELPEDFRLALVAVDVLGLSYREAGRALKVREATLTTRLFRARRQVAGKLGDAEGPGTAGAGGASPSRSASDKPGSASVRGEGSGPGGVLSGGEI